MAWVRRVRKGEKWWLFLCFGPQFWINNGATYWGEDIKDQALRERIKRVLSWTHGDGEQTCICPVAMGWGRGGVGGWS